MGLRALDVRFDAIASRGWETICEAFLELRKLS